MYLKNSYGEPKTLKSSSLVDMPRFNQIVWQTDIVVCSKQIANVYTSLCIKRCKQFDDHLILYKSYKQVTDKLASRS